MGHAARNVSGRVVLYADVITDSMRGAIAETQRRRIVQQEYNKEHGIDPQTIRKAVTDLVAQFRSAAGSGGDGFGTGAPFSILSTNFDATPGWRAHPLCRRVSRWPRTCRFLRC